MTSAQLRELRRFARRAVEARDYAALAAWCDAYADRPRPPFDLRPGESIRILLPGLDVEQHSGSPKDRWFARMRAWWYSPR